ncbi:MAG: hypothetical protein EP306_14040 [Burkholderiales bacterium]|nr:MAG: hypothetical protein EP306_14040 [Burkholderiales bacterium]
MPSPEDGSRARPDGRVRRWLAPIVALLGCLFLAACAPPPPPPLVLGLNPWVGYDPFIVAREGGMVERQRVKVVELTSNAEVVRHFRNGLLDGAAMTLDQAIQLADEGHRPRIVAVLDMSDGADVVLASPRVSLPMLRGQTILAEPSTVSALMLRGLLEAAGLERGDVTVLPLEATHHLPALRSGRALAAVSYEPLATRLRKEGFVTVYDSRRLPGQIMDVLVVREQHLTQRGADVDAMLLAWSAGLARLLSEPVSAAGWLAPSLDMSPQEYLDTLAGLRFMTPADSLAHLSGATAPIHREGRQLMELMRQEGLIRNEMVIADIVDPRPAARTLQAADAR